MLTGRELVSYLMQSTGMPSTQTISTSSGYVGARRFLALWSSTLPFNVLSLPKQVVLTIFMQTCLSILLLVLHLQLLICSTVLYVLVGYLMNENPLWLFQYLKVQRNWILLIIAQYPLFATTYWKNKPSGHWGLPRGKHFRKPRPSWPQHMHSVCSPKTGNDFEAFQYAYSSAMMCPITPGSMEWAAYSV